MATDVEVLGSRDSQRQRDLLLVEQVADAAEPLALPGHVYTKAWLCEQLGLGAAPADGASRDRWHMRYAALVQAWREEMGRRKVPTYTARRTGYAVVSHADATVLYQRETYQGMRRAIMTGLHRTEDWIDPNALTPAQQLERFDNLGRLRNYEHVLRLARPKPPKPPTMARPAAAAIQPPETPACEEVSAE